MGLHSFLPQVSLTGCAERGRPAWSSEPVMCLTAPRPLGQELSESTSSRGNHFNSKKPLRAQERRALLPSEVHRNLDRGAHWQPPRCERSAGWTP